MAKVEKPIQKVVIPKGIIDPNETTIIEIPENLHDQPVVVAKRKDLGQQQMGSAYPGDLTGNLPNCPPSCPLVATGRESPIGRNYTNSPKRTSVSRSSPISSKNTSSISPCPPCKRHPDGEDTEKCAASNTGALNATPRSNSAANSRQNTPTNSRMRQISLPAANSSQSATTLEENGAMNKTRPIECPFDLAETEARERQQLQADLERFQVARRKLLCNTTNLTGTTTEMLKPTSSSGKNPHQP